MPSPLPLPRRWKAGPAAWGFILLALLFASTGVLRASATDESPAPLDARGPDGETRLFRAARMGNVESVRFLLAKGADPLVDARRWPGDRGWIPLTIAALGGHADVVLALLDAGTPVDSATARGRTPLVFAAWYGRTAVVELLLVRGADPSRRDRTGENACTLGRSTGHREVAALLDEAPACAAGKP